MLAPIGVQEILHPDAELATARAAAAVGVPLVVSTVSSRSLEEIAQAAPDAVRWFQLCPGRDAEITKSLVRRAEAAGYSALMITVDTTLPGCRPRDLGRGYLPFAQGLGIGNFVTDPVFRSGLASSPEDDLPAAGRAQLEISLTPELCWDDLAKLVDATSLPVIVKGVLHPDDARAARDLGVAGVIVSNHGGRQLDGAIAALDAFPDIADAVGPQLPVLFDSGVRSGADVVTALALGVSAVLLGRPYAYGLAAAGQDGVERVVRTLRAEVDVTLALSGHRCIADVDRDLLASAVR